MAAFTTLFKILRAICFIYSVFLLLFCLDYNSRKKKKGSDPEPNAFDFLFYKNYKSKVRLIIFIILGILCFPPVFQNLQNTNIGSILEEEVYEECYYVYIREDNTRAKSYRVKADIKRGYLGSSTEGFFCDESFALKSNGYFVERIYWGNGGSLSFYADEYDLDFSPARIYPGRETKVLDKNDDKYYVTLTLEKAK